MVPFAFTGLVEGVGWIHRKIVRGDYHARARERAAAVGRPFVVVGSPSGGMTGGYPCGDYCVDLDGCTQCGAPARDLQREGGIPVARDSAVVFVCYTLECCDDIDAAWREVCRAAGSTDNIYVAAVQPWATWTNVFYPGIRWIVEEAPPTSKKFVYRSLVAKPHDVTKLLVHP